MLSGIVIAKAVPRQNLTPFRPQLVGCYIPLKTRKSFLQSLFGRFVVLLLVEDSFCLLSRLVGVGRNDGIG
jgi:hypothetical protein